MEPILALISTAVVPPPAKGPSARTRKLMLETAIRLLQRGEMPSVSDLGQAAGVSRATAYRYFPSQAAMVQAVVDEALGPILDWDTSRTDPADRVCDLLETALPRLAEFESTFRAALRFSLDDWARRDADPQASAAQFVRGHRLVLLRKALAPAQTRLASPQFDQLVNALAVVFGVESLVVLRDICGLGGDGMTQVSQWMARKLVDGALAETPTDQP